MESGILHNATLVLPDQICLGGIIWQDGLVRDIFPESDLKQELNEFQSQSRPQSNPKRHPLPEATALDMEGDLIVPGFIDTHVHGTGGFDVMDCGAAGRQALQSLAEALLREGTTAFLPTTMSCPPAQLTQVLQNTAKFRGRSLRGAEILGLHLESPFLAKEFRGAQRPEAWDEVRDNNKSFGFFANLLRQFPDLIKILTFAPERPEGQELTSLCLRRGVIPSAGHTAADFTQMEQAIRWGLRHVTHAFNAMPSIHHRQPGLLTKALLDDTVTLEIIADGIHIHPAVLALTFKHIAPERICLVSDGTRAVSMPDGQYELGGQTTIVRHGLARLPDGTIAGSACPLRQGLKTLLHQLHLPLPQAVRYATLNPAKLLGVDDRLGSLEINKEATFLRLSPEFDLKQVWLQGRSAFEAKD